MTQRTANIGLRLAGWAALAYLGYWLALLLDDLFLRLTLYPLLGAGITDWRLTAFRASLSTGDPNSLPFPPLVRNLLPLLLQLGFLALLLMNRTRVRRLAIRTWLYSAGLWVVLLLTSQVALLAFLRRGRFTSIFSALAPAFTQSSGLRWAVSILAFAALVVAGVACAKRLAACFEAWLHPRPPKAWLFLIAFVLPILFVLAGTFGFALRFLGTRWIFSFSVPAVFCLLLGLAGWRLHRSASGRPPISPEHFAERQSFASAVAVGCALLLGTGLQQANRVEALLHEQRLAYYSTAHYEIRYDATQFPADRIRSLGAERERILENLASRLRFAGESADSPALDDLRIRVILFSDFAAKRAATSSDRPFNTDGTTIRALLYGPVRQIDPAADAAAVLHATWGPAGSPLVEIWVARLLAGEFRGRTVEDWTAQIESEVGHYTLAELLSASDEQFVSPLVHEPLGAAWIGWVYQHHGLGAVRKLYSSKASPLDLDAAAHLLNSSSAQLEGDWARWTQQLRARAVPRQSVAARPLPDDFLRGVSFSHEGFGRRRGGYVDPSAVEQLRKLRDLGANAISVIPYGLMRNIQDPSISMSFTDETDEELTQALFTAHQFGLRVMLKPHLWVSLGQFSGNVRFDDSAARARWMRNYREFILHYARLAELEGFDLLCIGNELEGMTASEADWRRLIGEIRRVYRGPITYAANWGREFETIRFWDALDAAGLNNYYPLTAPLRERRATEAQAVSAASARAGARALAAKLEEFHSRWRKPILFTEVGYPSVRGGTAEPWIEDGARGLSPEEQAAGYEAVFQAFSNKPWLRGMFWWKWPSSGRGGGLEDPSFVPLGKPAEQVLRTWYMQLEANAKNRPSATP